MGLLYRKQPVKAYVIDQTTSRSFETIYQNTTGRPMLIIVSLFCLRASDTGARAQVSALVKSTSPPDIVRTEVGFTPSDTNEEEAQFCVVFPVPNQHYYKITVQTVGVGSLVTLTKWVEVEL